MHSLSLLQNTAFRAMQDPSDYPLLQYQGFSQLQSIGYYHQTKQHYDISDAVKITH